MVERTYRAFIAVEFPHSVVKEVSHVQEVLAKWKFTGKITELENLHLTLKFLGEIEERKLEEVGKKLKEIKMDKFEVRLKSIGLFSFRGNPRIVWIKVGGKGIFELQKRSDEVLIELGVKPESRFMSHMTIARIKYVKDKEGFRKYVEGMGLKEVKFTINNFKLKTSELRAIGPIYRDIGEYSLE